ncbi:MAG: phytanoyl-CoA dioxygenase family protein [Pseudomonadota bacterium]
MTVMGTSGRGTAFSQDGYVFPIRVLSPQKAAEYLARFEAFDSSEAAGGFADIHREVYLFKPHLLLKWADALVHEPAILDAVSDILGPDLLCWSAGIFQKTPHSPHLVSWHQDAVYYGLSPADHVVRIWVALSPARVENGTMQFARGAHRVGLKPHRPQPTQDNLLSRGEVVQLDVSAYENVDVELAPGEASIHHLFMPHASGPNRSDIRRVNLVITYIAPDVRPASGEDSALPVRGVDRFGHFAQERRPNDDLSAAARQAHAAAMALRHKNFRFNAASIEVH